MVFQLIILHNISFILLSMNKLEDCLNFIEIFLMKASIFKKLEQYYIENNNNNLLKINIDNILKIKKRNIDNINIIILKEIMD